MVDDFGSRSPINLHEFDWEFIDMSALAVKQLHTIVDLLEVLDMGRVAPKMLQEGIDLPTLFFVTDEHLMQLGLTLSERVKLLRCIQILKDVPPPPASMASSFQRPAPPIPIPQKHPKPAPAESKYEEKQEQFEEEEPIEGEDMEAAVEEEAEAYAVEEEIPAEEEPEMIEEKNVGWESKVTMVAAGAGAMAAAASAVVAASSGDNNPNPEHSMIFLRSESEGVSEKYCTALQAAFEDDMKAKRVAFVPSDSAEQVLKCLEVFLADSSSEDDLLWVIFTGTGTEDELMPGLLFQHLAQKIEACYRGRRVFIIVDTCSYPEFAEEDEENATPKANENLQVSLLYSVYPASTPPNPCYLTLSLLDSVRGRVFARDVSVTGAFTLNAFAHDALDTIEFIARCSETDIQTSYVSTPEFNDENLEVVEASRVPGLKANSGACGLRGIYEDRPIVILDMNGPERIQIRFLDDDCDTEWANLSEVMLDTMEEEEQEEESGRQTLPVPPALMPEEELQTEQVQEEELVEEQDYQVEETAALEEMNEAVAVEEAIEEVEAKMDEELQVEEPSEDVAAGMEEEDTIPQEETVALEEEEAFEQPVEMEMEQDGHIQEEYVVEEPLAVEEEPVAVEDYVAVAEEPVAIEEHYQEEVMEMEEPVAIEEHIQEEMMEMEEPVAVEEHIQEEMMEEPVAMETMIDEQVLGEEPVVEEHMQEEVMAVEERAVPEEVIEEPVMLEEEQPLEEEAPVMVATPVTMATDDDAMSIDRRTSRISTLPMVEVEEMGEIEAMDETSGDLLNTEEPEMEMLHEEILLDDDIDLMEEEELIAEEAPVE